MKLIVMFLVLSISSANAGIFLRKNLYVTNDLTIGFGKSAALAEADAKSAIPKGYKIDKEGNSPAITCAFKEFPNEKGECATEKVRVELPLIPENAL